MYQENNWKNIKEAHSQGLKIPEVPVSDNQQASVSERGPNFTISSSHGVFPVLTAVAWTYAGKALTTGKGSTEEEPDTQNLSKC